MTFTVDSMRCSNRFAAICWSRPHPNPPPFHGGGDRKVRCGLGLRASARAMLIEGRFQFFHKL
jgi:hypothetical protein